VSTLSLEGYARILAHLACRRGASVEEILSELGVERDDFRRADELLRRELAVAWPRRKGIGAMKFATALGKELERLGPIGAPAQPEREPREPEPRETETAIPSYLQAPLPADPLPVAVAPAPERESPRVRFGGTADMDLSGIVAAIERGALPFAASLQRAAAQQRPSSPPPSAGEPAASPEPAAAETSEEIDLAAFPLEAYASVSGALARGESREEALAKHRLSAELFDKLAKAWAHRFEREPHLLARFKELARTSAASRRRDE
jgi:hypothetical protein